MTIAWSLHLHVAARAVALARSPDTAVAVTGERRCVLANTVTKSTLALSSQYAVRLSVYGVRRLSIERTNEDSPLEVNV